MTGPKEQQLRVLRDGRGRFLKGGGASTYQEPAKAHGRAKNRPKRAGVLFQLWLAPEALAAIDARRGALSRSEYLRNLIPQKETPSP